MFFSIDIEDVEATHELASEAGDEVERPLNRPEIGTLVLI